MRDARSAHRTESGVPYAHRASRIRLLPPDHRARKLRHESRATSGAVLHARRAAELQHELAHHGQADPGAGLAGLDRLGAPVERAPHALALRGWDSRALVLHAHAHATAAGALRRR